MDCEGCEYEVILKATKSLLNKFDYIILEYHYGTKNLLRKLKESGFVCVHTKPNYFRGGSKDAPTLDRYVELIFAKKRNS